MLCLRNNQSMRNIDLCAKRTKTLDMLVNRSATDITAAWQRNLRFFIFAKKRPQQIIGRSYFFDIIAVNYQIMNL